MFATCPMYYVFVYGVVPIAFVALSLRLLIWPRLSQERRDRLMGYDDIDSVDGE